MIETAEPKVQELWCLRSLVVIIFFLCSAPSFGQADSKPLVKVKSYSCAKKETSLGILVTFVGEVLNQSDRPLEHLQAMILLRSAVLELISTEEKLVDISPLLPGQTTTFRGIADRVNPRLPYVRSDFGYFLEQRCRTRVLGNMRPIQTREQ
jgi:hypothetical protein